MPIRRLLFFHALLCLPCSAETSTMTWAAGQKLMGRYCIDCHDADLAKGDLDLEKLTKATVLHDYKLWQNLPALQW